jgi:hypothetical protein
MRKTTMRKLLTVSLLGTCLVAAASLVHPVPASADGGVSRARSCNGPFARFRPSCRANRVTAFGVAGVPTDPSVPEPGAAALFALGAGLIAARSRGPSPAQR